MEQERGRNYKTLAVVVVLAMVYGGWMITQRTITDIPRLDGIIGVLLGLFICSRPAANMLDLLFTRRGQLRSAEWSAIGWLILNGLVMIVGWIVITIGATRLIDRVL
jgi:EamA domain-containing membrane protein RarD